MVKTLTHGIVHAGNRPDRRLRVRLDPGRDQLIFRALFDDGVPNAFDQAQGGIRRLGDHLPYNCRECAALSFRGLILQPLESSLGIQVRVATSHGKYRGVCLASRCVEPCGCGSRILVCPGADDSPPDMEEVCCVLHRQESVESCLGVGSYPGEKHVLGDPVPTRRFECPDELLSRRGGSSVPTSSNISRGE